MTVSVEGTAGNTATLEPTEYSNALDFLPDEQLSAEPAGNVLQVGRRLFHDVENRLTDSQRMAETGYVKMHSCAEGMSRHVGVKQNSGATGQCDQACGS